MTPELICLFAVLYVVTDIVVGRCLFRRKRGGDA